MQDYFEQLSERVLLRIETEHSAPSLTKHNKKFVQTDLPTNYFEGLEGAVFARIAAETEVENKKNMAFAQQKPTFSITKTNRKIWWSAAAGTAAAAILAGVLFLQPNKNTEIADLHAPLSVKTEQLFAEVNTSEALTYLQNEATNLDESILEKKLTKNIAHSVQNSFSDLKNEDIADFANENNLVLE